MNHNLNKPGELVNFVNFHAAADFVQGEKTAKTGQKEEKRLNHNVYPPMEVNEVHKFTRLFNIGIIGNRGGAGGWKGHFASFYSQYL
jgi:hypothetical protein